MRRYPAYDPPEYHDWQPDAATQAQFRATLEADPERAALIAGARGDIALLERLYTGLLRARLYDIALQRWVKQGVISKAWLATGEEAATVGAVHALEPRDVVAPMIRNAGACIEKGMSLVAMFSAYLATVENPALGRDLHTGDLACDVITPISHVAALVPVVAGAALAFKMDGEPRAVMTWAGDGSTRCGEFHEGVNLAAVYRVPAIFVVQNNQVALGTRTAAHSRAPMQGLAAAYGIPCVSADGNNVLDVWAATRQARAQVAAGQGPVLMVVETFRMGGHATHDVREGRRLFDAEVFAAWGKRDPIGMFETWLAEEGLVSRARLEALEAEVVAAMEAAAAAALADRERKQPDPATVLQGLFANPL